MSEALSIPLDSSLTRVPSSSISSLPFDAQTTNRAAFISSPTAHHSLLARTVYSPRIYRSLCPLFACLGTCLRNRLLSRKTKEIVGEASRVDACCVDFSLRETCPIVILVFFLLPSLLFPLPPFLLLLPSSLLPLSIATPPSTSSPHGRYSARSLPRLISFVDFDDHGLVDAFLSIYRHTISLRSST